MWGDSLVLRWLGLMEQASALQLSYGGCRWWHWKGAPKRSHISITWSVQNMCCIPACTRHVQEKQQ